jgi:thiamine pyrophosphate-dependent acetolactate synthase large subunit-like protein
MTNRAAPLEQQGSMPGSGDVVVSDLLAEALRLFQVPCVVTPLGQADGPLVRSLQTSNAADQPGLLFCIEERHVVAIARGYASVAARPVVAVIDAAPGLLQCLSEVQAACDDHLPILLLGIEGDDGNRQGRMPEQQLDSGARTLLQHMVRYASRLEGEGAAEILGHALSMCQVHPAGPAYLAIRTGLQEAAVVKSPQWRELQRYRTSAIDNLPHTLAAEAGAALAEAERPVMLVGRVSRSQEAWIDRIRLAETIGAHVVSDARLGSSFPTAHPMHVRSGDVEAAFQVIRDADVILSLGWRRLSATLRDALDGEAPSAFIIHAAPGSRPAEIRTANDAALVPLPVDLHVPVRPDAVVRQLVAELAEDEIDIEPSVEPETTHGSTGLRADLRAVASGKAISWINMPPEWTLDDWHFATPLDALGLQAQRADGSILALAVGAAAALRQHGRLAVVTVGANELAAGVSALWSAVRHRLPLVVLLVGPDNRSRQIGGGKADPLVLAEQFGIAIFRESDGNRLEAIAKAFATGAGGAATMVDLRGSTEQ